jgi:hypothetical protein
VKEFDKKGYQEKEEMLINILTRTSNKTNWI